MDRLDRSVDRIMFGQSAMDVGSFLMGNVAISFCISITGEQVSEGTWPGFMKIQMLGFLKNSINENVR